MAPSVVDDSTGPEWRPAKFLKAQNSVCQAKLKHFSSGMNHHGSIYTEPHSITSDLKESASKAQHLSAWKPQKSIFLAGIIFCHFYFSSTCLGRNKFFSDAVPIFGAKCIRVFAAILFFFNSNRFTAGNWFRRSTEQSTKCWEDLRGRSLGHEVQGVGDAS